MNIAIGADHRGTNISNTLVAHLKAHGHTIESDICGCESCDYPDSAYWVATRVADGRADRGILICSNGLGMSMAANKVHGVRAALIYDAFNAEQSRRHNDANVLCLGSESNSAKELMQLVDLWLSIEFEGGRHERRVRKMEAIERGEDPATIKDATPTAAKAR